MLIVVDPHSGVPVYRQIMDQIRFHVASGLVKPGDELPSTRALSSELGVNPMTISKAYSFLEREGVIEHRPGRPLVVREFGEDRDIQSRKTEQLCETLAPIITSIRQLGIEKDRAIQVFSQMLGEESENPNPEDTEP
jgi:GntR family transcriptional regulator